MAFLVSFSLSGAGGAVVVVSGIRFNQKARHPGKSDGQPAESPLAAQAGTSCSIRFVDATERVPPFPQSAIRNPQFILSHSLGHDLPDRFHALGCGIGMDDGGAVARNLSGGK